MSTDENLQTRGGSDRGYSSREYLEKRDFIRMRIDSPVDVLIAGETGAVQGICRDLSGGGMLIEVESRLAANTEVEVTLASSHGHAPILRANATVVRIEGDTGSDGSLNRVGLRLKNVLG